MASEQWFVNENDLVGGYSVGTAPGPASYNRRYGDVADLMSEVRARQIVAEHYQIERDREVIRAARAYVSAPTGYVHELSHSLLMAVRKWEARDER